MTLLAVLSPNTTHIPAVYFHTKAMKSAYLSSIGVFIFLARGAGRSLLSRAGVDGVSEGSTAAASIYRRHDGVRNFLDASWP